jgi:hypothetical protein
MPDFLKATFDSGTPVMPLDVLVRLLVALAMGGVVAWIHRRTRHHAETSTSFSVTLVLLAVLIAMVTQVIGNNVARAFSLVGALSIVRFRTVVRDTQDTAYVIFSVVVGMAIGARDLWVGIIGIVVIGMAAFLMMTRAKMSGDSIPTFLLSLRIGVGHDLETLIGNALKEHFLEHKLVSVATAKQGSLLEVIYETRLRPSGSPETLVKALNQIEGIQSVRLQHRGYELD